MRTLLGTMALAVMLSACHPTSQVVYLAPSNDTIHMETEQGHGNLPSHTIYVVNQSSAPITVFGVALRACENVRQSCDPQEVNISVPPGERRIVFRVEPKLPTAGFTYRFNYSWRPAAPKPPQP